MILGSFFLAVIAFNTSIFTYSTFAKDKDLVETIPESTHEERREEVIESVNDLPVIQAAGIKLSAKGNEIIAEKERDSVEVE